MPGCRSGCATPVRPGWARNARACAIRRGPRGVAASRARSVRRRSRRRARAAARALARPAAKKNPVARATGFYGSAPAAGVCLERCRVAGELRVCVQHVAQNRQDIFRGGAAAREDALHVVAGRTVERGLVCGLDAQQMRERVERLTAADRHVARQALLVAVDEHRGLPGRAHGAVLRATRGAEADAESLIEESAVRNTRERLRDDSGLTVENLGAPAAATNVVDLCESRCGHQQDCGSGDSCELFHDNLPCKTFVVVRVEPRAILRPCSKAVKRTIQRCASCWQWSLSCSLRAARRPFSSPIGRWWRRQTASACVTNPWHCVPPTASSLPRGSCRRGARRKPRCSSCTATPRTSARISSMSPGCRRKDSTCSRSTIAATARRRARHPYRACSATSMPPCRRCSRVRTWTRVAS